MIIAVIACIRCGHPTHVDKCCTVPVHKPAFKCDCGAIAHEAHIGECGCPDYTSALAKAAKR